MSRQIANVLLDANVTPDRIAREGIRGETAARIASARAAGRELKLVACADGRGSAAKVSVQLLELEPGDPLAALDGPGNALELDTWPLGRVVITQRDGGLEQTAYALLSDLITLRRRL
jgi:homoserine dehydrogenase